MREGLCENDGKATVFMAKRDRESDQIQAWAALAPRKELPLPI